MDLTTHSSVLCLEAPRRFGDRAVRTPKRLMRPLETPAAFVIQRSQRSLLSSRSAFSSMWLPPSITLRELWETLRGESHTQRSVFQASSTSFLEIIKLFPHPAHGTGLLRIECVLWYWPPGIGHLFCIGYPPPQICGLKV